MSRHWRRREFVRYGAWIRAVVGAVVVMLAAVTGWLLVAFMGAGISALWD